MDAKQRRQFILDRLKKTEGALSASTLATDCGVSRQVVVGDIALLRAQGATILATHRGYLLMDQLVSSDYRGTIVCQHGPDRVREELDLILSLGARLMTIEVDHPLYGSIKVPLSITSQEDLNLFLSEAEKTNGGWLSHLTNGIHMHEVVCSDRKAFNRLEQALDQAGFLYKG